MRHPLPTMTVVLYLSAHGSGASAALPPPYQNVKDLDAMVEWIRLHPRVAGTLRSIDLRQKVIHFGADCRAQFGRQPVDRPPGWVGPQAPLVFTRSSCPVE